jgi:glucose-1-phosphate adenylyltransferase
LVRVDPPFNLYGEHWPLRAYERSLPPSKYIFEGKALNSMVSDGCIISGGTIKRSILSPGVIVERDAIIEESIIFDDVNIEPGARIKRAIIDTGVRIKSGESIGYDLEADTRKGCTISDKGVVVVPGGMVIGHD